jgi:gliding motility-associated-like protein
MNKFLSNHFLPSLLVFLSGALLANNNYLSYSSNKGQWENNILYKADLNNGALYLEKDRITVSVFDKQEYLYRKQHLHHSETYKPKLHDYLDFFAYQVIFNHSNKNVTISNEVPTEGYNNYFIGNDKSKWRSKVLSYQMVTYHDLYEKIDLKHYSIGNSYKYDIICHPNSNIDLVRFSYKGVDKMYVENGMLFIVTSFDTIKELAPIAYQYINGIKIKVACEYQYENFQLGFHFPEGFNKSVDLIIDPSVIFSTYSGSVADNFGCTATYDGQGNAFAAGTVFGNGYPVTLGAYQLFWAGGTGAGSLSGTDVAITKYNATGSLRLYSTYLGGNSDEMPHSIIVNSNDELFVLGTTSSTNFPTTFNTYDSTFNSGTRAILYGLGLDFLNGTDMFVTRFSADGSSLIASTYLGGSANDGINTSAALRFNYADEARGEILIDKNDNIYIGSSTYSADFPVTSGAFQSIKDSGQEGCITKMDNSLRTIIWSTFFGGRYDDAIYSLELDKETNVYFTGGTVSDNLPITPTAFRTFYGGGRCDGYVSKLNNTGNVLLTSTYIGSDAYDQSYFVEMNKKEEVFLLGQTLAAGDTFIFNAAWNFPGSGQFVMKLKNNLDTLVWSTVFGSAPYIINISPTAFLVDLCNKAYICGWGGPTVNRFGGAGSLPVGGTSGLPITVDALQSTTDNNDFYLLVINDDASNISYGSYFGGTGPESEHVDGGTSRFDRNGIVYQSVCASCGADQTFPIYPHPDSVVSSTNNSFNCNNAVFKFDFNLPIILAKFDASPVKCVPADVVFHNNSRVFSTTIVNWDFGDGGVSNVFSPTHNYSLPGSYTVRLIVIDSTSCNIADTAYQNVLIIKNGRDTLSQLVVCDSQSVQLGFASISDTSVTYLWTPSASLSRPDISNPIATPTSNTDYICYVTVDGCSDTFIQPVKIFEASLLLTGGAVLCPFDVLTIHVQNLIPEVPLTFTWTPSSYIISGANTADPQVRPPDTTTFYVTAMTAEGCRYSDSINVYTLAGGPDVLASSSKDTVDAGESVLLFATSSNMFNTYLWSPLDIVSNPTTQNTSAIINNTQVFEVIATDSFGCKESDTVIVYRRSLTCGQTAIFVPNAFSPNNDGMNDRFYVRAKNLNKFYVAIYDRWGERVYESTDLTEGWDGTYKGKLLDPSVFGYYVEGVCERDEKFTEQGNITLIR